MRSLLFLATIFSVCLVHSADPSIHQFLVEFHENADRAAVQQIPLDPAAEEERMRIRRSIIARSMPEFQTWTGMTEADRPELLVDGAQAVLNIKELDRLGLNSRSLTHLQWSDTYWPTANGLIASRYAEPTFPNNRNWSANHESYLSHPPYTIATDNLSPAEKYDLLVGDSDWTLTKYSWRQGKVINDALGRVPSWMGLCHGWSAANQMQNPIPYASITLRSRSGQAIKFYQSDMKALVTMMWAKTELPTRFIGYRCEISAPRDGTGRTIDPKCFDTNPASLHLTLLNQVGLKDRGFVIDATAAAEVWNYPVVGYKSTYFNPQTLLQTDNLNLAIVPKNQFTIDKFKTHRPARAAYIVGVSLELTHLNETSPSRGVQIKPATLTQRYIYDLELDSEFNVIGGEWYSRTHPDFIWGYAADAIPLTPQDLDLFSADWDITQPVPASWTLPAQKASSLGMPLYSVIRRILLNSQTSP